MVRYTLVVSTSRPKHYSLTREDRQEGCHNSDPNEAWKANPRTMGHNLGACSCVQSVTALEQCVPCQTGMPIHNAPIGQASSSGSPQQGSFLGQLQGGGQSAPGQSNYGHLNNNFNYGSGNCRPNDPFWWDAFRWWWPSRRRIPRWWTPWPSRRWLSRRIWWSWWVSNIDLSNIGPPNGGQPGGNPGGGPPGPPPGPPGPPGPPNGPPDPLGNGWGQGDGRTVQSKEADDIFLIPRPTPKNVPNWRLEFRKTWHHVQRIPAMRFNGLLRWRPPAWLGTD